MTIRMDGVRNKVVNRFAGDRLQSVEDCLAVGFEAVLA